MKLSPKVMSGMAHVDPQTHPKALGDLRACDNAVFIEQVRLLYQPRGVIAISLVIAGLGAWAVLDLFPA